MRVSLAIAAAALTLGAAGAPAPARAQERPTTLNSRGPVMNPFRDAVLAEITDIAPGPHTFRVVISAAGLPNAAAVATVIEWRDGRDSRTAKVKWSQGIIVRQNDTIVVPFEEPHEFAEGDTLRLSVFTAAAGTVWGSISLK